MNSKSPIRNNAPLGQLVIQLDEQICMLRCFYCTEQPALDTITCTMTTSRWNLDLICKVWHIHLQRLTTDDAQTNEQTNKDVEQHQRFATAGGEGQKTSKGIPTKQYQKLLMLSDWFLLLTAHDGPCQTGARSVLVCVLVCRASSMTWTLTFQVETSNTSARSSAAPSAG